MNQNQENIDEHLLLQYLLGNACAEERDGIEAWLNESKENRLHLDRLESLWLETGKISPAPVAVDVQAAWRRIVKRMDNQESGNKVIKSQSKVIRMPFVRYILGAAAVLLLLIGIYTVYLWIARPVQRLEMVAEMGILQDTLPDGSGITLNTGSRLTYPERFNNDRRVVKLKGEAYFRVHHDPACPFIVDAGKASVRVLGTSFHVKAIPGEEIVVSVDEGRVLLFTYDSISGDSSSVRLEAGMQGVLYPGKTIPELVSANPPDDMFWFDKRLVFKETGLQEVFNLLQAHYHVNILVSDHKISSCKLTATFINDSIGSIMQVIATSFSLDLKKEKDNYLLIGNGCDVQKP